MVLKIKIHVSVTCTELTKQPLQDHVTAAVLHHEDKSKSCEYPSTGFRLCYTIYSKVNSTTTSITFIADSRRNLSKKPLNAFNWEFFPQTKPKVRCQLLPVTQNKSYKERIRRVNMNVGKKQIRIHKKRRKKLLKNMKHE